jgi:5'-nucleotidase
VRRYDGKVVAGQDPLGRQHFWFTVTPIKEVEEGTDRWAVRQELVSMTPLRLDLTNEEELARIRSTQVLQSTHGEPSTPPADTPKLQV